MQQIIEEKVFPLLLILCFIIAIKVIHKIYLSTKEDEGEAFKFVVLSFLISFIISGSIVSGILYSLTLVTYSIDFSWLAVTIISGIISTIFTFIIYQGEK